MARTQYFLDNKNNIDKKTYTKWALNGYAAQLADHNQKNQPMYNEWAKEHNEPLMDCMNMSDEDKIKRWENFAIYRGARHFNVDESYLQSIAKKAAELLSMINSKSEINRIISDVLGNKDITLKVPEGHVTRLMNPGKDFLDSLQIVKERLPEYAKKKATQKHNWNKVKDKSIAPLIWLYEEIMQYGGISQVSAHNLVNVIFNDLGATIGKDNTDKRKKLRFNHFQCTSQYRFV